MNNIFYKFGLKRLRKVLSPDLRKRIAGFKKIKNHGIVILIPTIILSGLILVVAIGLSKVLITELEFSADLLFSEKAYFAAESGIEKSLLALKNRPLNWVDEKELKVGKGATYDLEIFNSVAEFPFKLSKNETVKFRLGVDDNSTFDGYNTKPVHSFEITPHNKNLKWKILCQTSDTETVSLLGRGDNFEIGTFDNGNRIEKGYYLTTFLSEVGDDICFMSLTNLQGTDTDQQILNPAKLSQPEPELIEGVISGKVVAKTLDQRIAPAKTVIRSVGKSYSREKIVIFQYLQKNLSSLFDLGFYYIEGTENPSPDPIDQLDNQTESLR